MNRLAHRDHPIPTALLALLGGGLAAGGTTTLRGHD